VADSWEINNPEWIVHLLDEHNITLYVSDIEYMYDEKKCISPQAKSDIIRLSLLKNYGGVWADSTMLCMQPLDSWVHEAVEPSGIWMYRGPGAGMSPDKGPTVWFIVSKPYGYMITQWKQECDIYWNKSIFPYTYYWLDEWFKTLYEKDEVFRTKWLHTPSINCEQDGQSHTMSRYRMENCTPRIQQLFIEKPPYALKFWNRWNEVFPDPTTEYCQRSNGYVAIQLSKRKTSYKHMMTL
jgi:hypothetical protein